MAYCLLLSDIFLSYTKKAGYQLTQTPHRDGSSIKKAIILKKQNEKSISYTLVTLVCIQTIRLLIENIAEYEIL